MPQITMTAEQLRPRLLALAAQADDYPFLTAVEDYLAQTHWRFRLVVVPAVFGLAILLPDALAANKPALAQRVAAWDVPEIRKFIERMEMARIAMLTGARG